MHFNAFSSPDDNPATGPIIEEVYHSTGSKSMHFIIGVGSISGEEMLGSRSGLYQKYCVNLHVYFLSTFKRLSYHVNNRRDY